MIYCTTGGDFNDSYSLAAGSYTVATGVFGNMSFAENLGSGTLGDGFIGIGNPGSLGNSFYQLDVTTDGGGGGGGGTVPEPGSLPLLGIAVAAAGLARRRETQPA